MASNGKKVLLIYPKIIATEHMIDIPLSLMHLGTILRDQGYDARLLSRYLDENFDELLLEQLGDCFCIGITAMTAQLPDAIRITQLIKGRRPDLPVVFGGAHTTLFPKQIGGYPLIDYAITGEGEQALPDLLKAIEAGEKPVHVGGAVYRDDDGQVVINEEKALYDYSKMPPYDFSLLSEDNIKLMAKNRIPLLSSKGCPYRCRFCITTVIPEYRKWRAWDAKRTADEVENVLSTGASYIVFNDENFCLDKKRVKEFCAEIRERGITFSWWANVRADTIKEGKIDSALLDEMKACGFQFASIGAESGSEVILKYLQKDITPEDLLRSARMLEDAGVTPVYSFMIGTPAEKRDDVRATMSVIRELSLICPTARFLGPQLFRPYPGSKLYDECLAAGWQEPESIEEWIEKIEAKLVHSTPKDLPWIKDKNFIYVVWFYSVFISLRTKVLAGLFIKYCREYRRSPLFLAAGTVGVFLFSMLGKLRYRLNLYAFPIEVTMFKKYRLPLSS